MGRTRSRPSFSNTEVSGFTSRSTEYQLLEIWEYKEMPIVGLDGFIHPIRKKKHRLKFANYTGISLLISTYKILSRIRARRPQKFFKKLYQDFFFPNLFTRLFQENFQWFRRENLQESIPRFLNKFRWDFHH